MEAADSQPGPLLYLQVSDVTATVAKSLCSLKIALDQGRGHLPHMSGTGIQQICRAIHAD